MNIGDTITVTTEIYDERKMRSQIGTRRAEVIYIHPALRYYTVRYSSGIRECFMFDHVAEQQSRADRNCSRIY